MNLKTIVSKPFMIILVWGSIANAQSSQDIYNEDYRDYSDVISSRITADDPNYLAYQQRAIKFIRLAFYQSRRFIEHTGLRSIPGCRVVAEHLGQTSPGLTESQALEILTYAANNYTECYIPPYAVPALVRKAGMSSSQVRDRYVKKMAGYGMDPVIALLKEWNDLSQERVQNMMRLHANICTPNTIQQLDKAEVPREYYSNKMIEVCTRILSAPTALMVLGSMEVQMHNAVNALALFKVKDPEVVKLIKEIADGKTRTPRITENAQKYLSNMQTW